MPALEMSEALVRRARGAPPQRALDGASGSRFEFYMGKPENSLPRPPRSPAAARALAEAAARRAEARKGAEKPQEKHGREGLDPTRYGDWEVKGLASDF